MTFLTLFFLILLIILPLIAYVFFSVYKEKKLRLLSYYLMEAITILLLTTIGHMYYYYVYNLNVLPNTKNLNTMIFILLGVTIILYIFNSISSRLKKTKKVSIQAVAVFFLIILLFLTWIIPLGHKYLYVNRLDTKEELFANPNEKSVVTDEDKNMMVALIDSSYDQLTRPRTGRTYDNYFHIRNNGSTPYNGNIYLTLFNEDNETTDVKLFKDVTVGPNSEQLLIETRKNSFQASEWNEQSFTTKQKVETFEALISGK
ncbi:hypothetical protein J18TS1_23570 [Oceanobacillus oncorhynchi subsp. incaldanensis]|uniref:hypothetical protein n=1 Tax=Oceanobacillus oncorhynchi TaxID=545501 RepID=UPI001B093FBC|nr:hypothetical protein [Oceanobacillus oncorhynchi]GIO19257.1 hypothetical protein J18TS1_23570 [Oceanobacillus oncorhynchi subsp. incaldanensis]